MSFTRTLGSSQDISFYIDIYLFVSSRMHSTRAGHATSRCSCCCVCYWQSEPLIVTETDPQSWPYRMQLQSRTKVFNCSCYARGISHRWQRARNIILGAFICPAASCNFLLPINPPTHSICSVVVAVFSSPLPFIIFGTYYFIGNSEQIHEELSTMNRTGCWSYRPFFPSVC